MINSLKSELRKLLSIRSTYVVTIMGLLVVGPLFGFWGSGLEAGDAANSPLYMTTTAMGSASFISIFISIIALLAVTHEYRYNTITYTLTSSNSRTKTLLAKMIVIFAMSLAVTAVAVAFGQLMASFGMSVKGVELTPQTFDLLNVAWRVLYYGAANAIFAAILAVLIRNQVGAIMTFFIVINTVEGLFGQLILKHNAKWLPFTSLQHVVNYTEPGSIQDVARIQGHWWPGEAALLFTVYLVILGAATWFLFLRRDAN